MHHRILSSAASGTVPTVQRYHPIDLVLGPDGIQGESNPFDIEASVAFCGPHGQALSIPVFYDGERGFVVRFSPTQEGLWRYQVHSRHAALHGRCGEARCAVNDHPAIHGALQVDTAHPHHFIYEDGTRCFLLGYEANWLMMVDQQPSDLTRIDSLLDSIAAAGFNMITVNAYAHTCRGWVTPEQESDPRYITPSLAPWVGGNAAPDYRRFDVRFFQHYDRVMDDLLDRGILAHIMIHVYNKQVNWPSLSSEEDDRFWRYFVARYQAFCNVIWDVAKESYYREADYVWLRMGSIRHHDGYRRLLTVHDPWREGREEPGGSDYRKDLTDALADFKADQIHHDWRQDAARSYLARQQPYVNIEYGYEQGVDELPTYGVKQPWHEVLRRTWLVTMGGAYANYYYSNTAWNLFVPAPEPPGYPHYRRYRDFWEGLRYWTLAPDEGLLEPFREGVYCRSDVGREYVIFDETGEGFGLRPEGLPDALRAIWFNPISGERMDAGLVSAGGHHFMPPWGPGVWAVLWLQKAGASD